MDKQVLRQAYRAFTEHFSELSHDEKIDFLRFNRYFHERVFFEIVEIYLQNPQAKFVAPLNYWQEKTSDLSEFTADNAITVYKGEQKELLFDVSLSLLDTPFKYREAPLDELVFFNCLLKLNKAALTLNRLSYDMALLDVLQSQLVRFITPTLDGYTQFSSEEKAIAIEIATINLFENFGVYGKSDERYYQETTEQFSERFLSKDLSSSTMIRSFQLGNNISKYVFNKIETLVPEIEKELFELSGVNTNINTSGNALEDALVPTPKSEQTLDNDLQNFLDNGHFYIEDNETGRELGVESYTNVEVTPEILLEIQELDEKIKDNQGYFKFYLEDAEKYRIRLDVGDGIASNQAIYEEIVMSFSEEERQCFEQLQETELIISEPEIITPSKAEILLEKVKNDLNLSDDYYVGTLGDGKSFWLAQKVAGNVTYGASEATLVETYDNGNTWQYTGIADAEFKVQVAKILEPEKVKEVKATDFMSSMGVNVVNMGSDGQEKPQSEITEEAPKDKLFDTMQAFMEIIQELNVPNTSIRAKGEHDVEVVRLGSFNVQAQLAWTEGAGEVLKMNLNAKTVKLANEKEFIVEFKRLYAEKKTLFEQENEIIDVTESSGVNTNINTNELLESTEEIGTPPVATVDGLKKAYQQGQLVSGRKHLEYQSYFELFKSGILGDEYKQFIESEVPYDEADRDYYRYAPHRVIDLFSERLKQSLNKSIEMIVTSINANETLSLPSGFSVNTNINTNTNFDEEIDLFDQEKLHTEVISVDGSPELSPKESESSSVSVNTNTNVNTIDLFDQEKLHTEVVSVDGSPELSPKESESSSISVSTNTNTSISTNANLIDFAFPDDLTDFYPTTVRQKVAANLEAIRLIKKLEENNQLANASEQEILAKYVGWGGLANHFFDETSDVYELQRQELRTLVTDTEYRQMQQSSLTAYYTDPKIIQAIYLQLVEQGFEGGHILDPSMGTGNFFSNMPDYIKENSQLFGVELDSLTGAIAKQLHQTADIQIKGFEDTNFSDAAFDLVISNVPFANLTINDDNYDKPYLIHDYFINKSLDLVHEGGIVAIITSSGTMDKKDARFRAEVQQKAKLLGGVRLPNTAFKAIAGTSVTTDILFFQKQSSPEQSFEWLGTVEKNDGQGNKIAINDYFARYPLQVLGDIKIEKFNGGTLSVTPRHSGKAFDIELQRSLLDIRGEFDPEKRVEQVYKPSVVSREFDQIPEAVLTQIEPYTLLAHEAQIYYHDGVTVTPYRKTASVTIKVDEDRPRQLKRFENNQANIFDSIPNYVSFERENEETGELETVEELVSTQHYYYVDYSKKDVARVKEMVTLRHSLQDLLDVQHSPDFGQTGSQANLIYETRRAAFNIAYDQFVKAYGFISERANRTVMKHDDYYEFLASVEEVYEDDETKETLYKKAAVFFEPTISPVSTIIQVDSVQDALLSSINEKGTIDFEYMIGLTNLDKPAILEKLTGDIFYIGDDQYQTAVEFLSGDVKSKLTQFQIKQDFMDEDMAWDEQIKALKGVIPKDIPLHEIDYKLGSRFIPNDLYISFFAQIFDLKENEIHLSYDRFSDTYALQVDRSWKPEVSQTFGIPKHKGDEIATDVLNQTTPRFTKLDPSDPNRKRRIIAVEETQAAKEKAEDLLEAFKSWTVTNAKAQEQIVEIYNETNNRFVTPQYDGSNLTVRGVAKQFILGEHQENAVMRIIQDKRALLAHEVGSGKTLTMLAAGMKMKDLGMIHKPLYVVPKPLINQFGKEVYQYFPDAKFLVAKTEDFQKANRKRFISRIMNGKYDGIVIADSQFQKIGMSKIYQEQFINRQIKHMESTLGTLKNDGQQGLTFKKMQAALEKEKQRLEKLQISETDTFLDFEDLGVDFMFVDEAHQYKNLAPNTSLTDVKGVANTRSERALDMKQKVEYLQSQFDNRHVVFSTGTPMSNSVVELYTMMDFLAPDILEAYQMTSFDSWAASFGTIEENFEMTASNTYKMKKRFTKFSNLPELITQYRMVADIQTSEMLDLPVPEHEIISHETYVTTAQDAYINVLQERAQAVESGQVKPYEDNMLKIMSENRKLTLDARMLDDQRFNQFDSEKITQVADSVYQIWSDTSEQRGTQMIFSDLGVPLKFKNSPSLNLDGTVNHFSAYDELKRCLVDRGIPEHEIRFIHEATDKTKETMMKDMRRGNIRVLMASTSKGGTGLNVQDKMIAVHHLDVPWRPSDITQRNGRLIRQGNENDKVQVHYYLAKGSLDAFMWQAQAQKTKVINQVMKGDPSVREMEELDETAVTPATFSAITASNPLAFQLLQAEQALQLLDNAFIRFGEAKKSDANRLAKQKQELPMLEKRLIGIANDIETANTHLDKQAPVSLFLKERVKQFEFNEQVGRTQLGAQLHNLIRGNLSEKPAVTKLALYRGFEICHKSYDNPYQIENGTYLILRGQSDYTVPIDLKSPVGTLTRIDNKIESLEREHSTCKEQIAQYQENIQYLEKIKDDPFPKLTDLKNKKQEVEAIKAEMMAAEKPKETQRYQQEDDYDMTL